MRSPFPVSTSPRSCCAVSLLILPTMVWPLRRSNPTSQSEYMQISIGLLAPGDSSSLHILQCVLAGIKRGSTSGKGVYRSLSTSSAFTGSSPVQQSLNFCGECVAQHFLGSSGWGSCSSNQLIAFALQNWHGVTWPPIGITLPQ